MSEFYTFRETDGYKAEIQEEGGHLFLHLSVYNLTPTVYKDMKNHFPDVLAYAAGLGHDVLFTTSPDEQPIKLWKSIYPPFIIHELVSNGVGQGWIGSWETYKEK